jgi:hypothetical protein
MEKLCPKIKFVYSLPYDRLLAGYENKAFDEGQDKEVKEYIKNLQARWDEINDSVFKTLKEEIKNEWQEKEIKCYVVKYCKYNGFSAPLTIKLDTDFVYVIDTLIHELVHILISYNFEKYKTIEQELKKRFPEEDEKTILHIYINFIELKVLRKLFDTDFVNKMIERGKEFKGIGKAYKIVLNNESYLKQLFE